MFAKMYFIILLIIHAHYGLQPTWTWSCKWRDIVKTVRDLISGSIRRAKLM